MRVKSLRNIALVYCYVFSTLSNITNKSNFFEIECKFKPLPTSYIAGIKNLRCASHRQIISQTFSLYIIKKKTTTKHKTYLLATGTSVQSYPCSTLATAALIPSPPLFLLPFPLFLLSLLVLLLLTTTSPFNPAAAVAKAILFVDSPVPSIFPNNLLLCPAESFVRRAFSFLSSLRTCI